jgi:hypothetical protein
MNFIISKEFKAILASESYLGLVNSITHYEFRIKKAILPWFQTFPQGLLFNCALRIAHYAIVMI